MTTINPGDLVSFGRPNGEKTRAKVLRVAGKSVLVQTLEERGRDGRSAGRKWRVALPLVTRIEAKTIPVSKNGLSEVEQALVDVLDGQSANDLVCATGLSLERCEEIRALFLKIWAKTPVGRTYDGSQIK